MSPLIDPRPRPGVPDIPQRVDVNGIPFPGTYWALWDTDGNLLAHIETPVVTADWALRMLGWDGYTKITLGEFIGDKWERFREAYVTGAPTDFATWGPAT